MRAKRLFIQSLLEDKAEPHHLCLAEIQRPFESFTVKKA